MKKVHLLLVGAMLFAACQSKPATDAPAASATPNYPYKIKYPDNWAMDTSSVNTMTALGALKSYETKDTTAMKKFLTDSMEFNYDGGKYKGKSSGFIKMTDGFFTAYKTIKLKVVDWESVSGKVNKENWVTVWYTEYDTDMKGKTDSIDYVNDIKIKDGKIIRIDEYGRHFKPVK